jgi:hypothetical protein
MMKATEKRNEEDADYLTPDTPSHRLGFAIIFGLPTIQKLSCGNASEDTVVAFHP